MRESYNPDQIVVAGFRGLATAGGDYGADPTYLSTLTNAYVERDGRIVKRKGSNALYSIHNTTATPADLYQFSFAGEQFFAQKLGTQLSVYRIARDATGQAYNIQVLTTKNTVLRDASASERVSFAHRVEGYYCHVLAATASTGLVSLTLSYREGTVSSTTATTATLPVVQPYEGGVVSQSNSKLFTAQDVSPTTAIAVSGSNMTLTWVSRPADVVVGSKLKVFSCFWLRFVDANYYPGSSMNSPMLRRNTIPLDVNMEIPEQISGNPIFNEPAQDLALETLRIYEQTVVNAPRATKVASQQPAAVWDWDFSDGAYRVAAGAQTNRTPNFAAFGGLLPNNLSIRLIGTRLRRVLVGAFATIDMGELAFFVDGAATPVSYHDATTANIASGTTTFFSTAAHVGRPPGVNLEAVVELVLSFNTTNPVNGNASVYVDISENRATHRIGDGQAVPLYGYSLLAASKSFTFPPLVAFVGNRLVLSGTNNRILVSSSDWNYRGFSFTNTQVSSLGFNRNSPYLLSIEQQGGTVRAIASVNGVMVVSTDTSTYRVTGNERNNPPNAETAVVSRLSNQSTVNGCLTVAENTVYLANERGLYRVNYHRESDEGAMEDLSLPVSVLFKQQPQAVVYSKVFNSLLISFSGGKRVLCYSLLTKSFWELTVSVPYNLVLFSTLDGFTFTADTTLVVCSFNPLINTDVEFSGFITPATLQALTLAVNGTPVSAATVALPPALMSAYTSQPVVPVYGNKVRSVGSATVLTESTTGNTGKPIYASAGTKALYSDKLRRGLRLREAYVLFAGNGTARVALPTMGATEGSPQRVQIYNLQITADGTATVTGEQNKSPTTTYPVADTVLVNLGLFGSSEAYEVVVEVGTGVEWLGFSLNTAARAQQQLR